MTREEAIKWLNKLYARADITDEYGDMEDMQPYEEAVSMAIKALEQKPKTIQEIQAESEKYEEAFEDGYEQGYAQARFDYEQEPCEDTISRQAVINLIRRCNSALEEPRVFDCHNAGVKFEQYVTELQSVKPQEPKTGHWIEHFDESGKWYECDQCHTDWGGSVNFCPNCGADMGSEDKE